MRTHFQISNFGSISLTKRTQQIATQANLNLSSLPIGPGTEDYNLNTVVGLTGPRDFLPFFAGQNVRRPGSISIYAVVTEYQQLAGCPPVVDVKYHIFNPYNYGKEICVGFGFGPFCLGQGTNSIANVLTRLSFLKSSM